MKFKDLLSLPEETVCISLKDREDKRKKFKERWGDILNFRWYIADRYTEETLGQFLRNFNGGDPNELDKSTLGRWGCFLSHFEIMSSAKLRGVKSTLILEDDAYPNLELLDEKFNEPPLDWDIIYLGCGDYDTISTHPDQEITTDLTWNNSNATLNFHGWERVKAWGTYAMIINNTVYESFLREINDYTHLLSNYSHNVKGIRADGIYYFYLWKKMSFYLNRNFVLHDDSFESDIAIV